jgi:hypothetical protein
MQTETRKVVVTFAGGRRGPWQNEYQPTSPLSAVRSDAMAHFAVADSAEGGNQVIFRLFHGGERLDDLDQTVGAIGEGHGALALRLVREVIAG